MFPALRVFRPFDVWHRVLAHGRGPCVCARMWLSCEHTVMCICPCGHVPLPRPQVTGEATPSYMLGFSTARTIAAVLPAAKILLILRHPVDRFYSEYVVDGLHLPAMAHFPSFVCDCVCVCVCVCGCVCVALAGTR